MYPCPYWFLSYTFVPLATTLPLLIINILSDTHSAYYILWVVKRTVLFPLNYRIIFHVEKRILASIPVVGSSKTTNLGSPIKLIAKESLLLIPPEKVLTCPFLFSHKLTAYSPDWMPSGLHPFNFVKRSICWYAVISSHKISNWGQTPKIFLTSSIYVLISFSSIKTYPFVIERAPIKMLISVDFPAPFYPKSETISPSFNDRETPLTANVYLL